MVKIIKAIELISTFHVFILQVNSGHLQGKYNDLYLQEREQ